jgi:hypothetical protein
VLPKELVFTIKVLLDNGAHVILTGRANAEEQLHKVVKGCCRMMRKSMLKKL